MRSLPYIISEIWSSLDSKLPGHSNDHLRNSDGWIDYCYQMNLFFQQEANCWQIRTAGYDLHACTLACIFFPFLPSPSLPVSGAPPARKQSHPLYFYGLSPFGLNSQNYFSVKHFFSVFSKPFIFFTHFFIFITWQFSLWVLRCIQAFSTNMLPNILLLYIEMYDFPHCSFVHFAWLCLTALLFTIFFCFRVFAV